MKIFFFALFCVFTSYSISAQDLTGSWNGVLKVSGTQLGLTINITSDNNHLLASLDVPVQRAKDLKADSIRVTGQNVTIHFNIIKSIFVGKYLNDSTLNGEWQQGGLKIPLDLKKGNAKLMAPKRPQMPRPPFPYEAKEVVFENKKAGIKLAGTLTVPAGNGNFPAVILISGSGPQNRDSEIFGHKSFAIIADYLSRNGIAVLRYDDRGVSKSEGNFSAGTTYDFADDAASALDFLKLQKRINTKKIGLIGHSEGGLIAPVVASRPVKPDFFVLLAAPAMEINELMLEQARLINEASGSNPELLKLQLQTNSRAFDLIKKGPMTDSIRRQIEDVFANQIRTIAQGSLAEKDIQNQAAQITRSMTTPWFIGFMNFKPKEYLAKVKGPVLALNGSKDLQVPAKQNLAIIKDILGKNPKVKLTVHELPGLNHLFQTAGTGSVSEYEQIEETFSPEVLKIIADWILKL